METINGHIINNLPIKGLKKISDLQYYDGPILSHFIDERENNYLYYWVDFNTDCNRWLVWKISINQLYSYIHNKMSLLDILQAPNKDFVYSVDIDRELNYTAVWAIELDQIPSDYLPDYDSFFEDTIPDCYTNYAQFESKNIYLEKLREYSINFKLMPSTPKYGTTISTTEAANFLSNLSNSFLHFIEYSFFDEFKTSFTDLATLYKQLKQIQKDLIPRISNLEYSSFKVSIATDYLQRNASESRYDDWKKLIFSQYKSSVIDIDYSSINVINHIVSNYNEEDRKKIFAPFIKIIDNDDYNLEVTDNKNSYKRTYSSLKKEYKSALFPKLNQEDIEIDNKKLVNVVIEIDKNQDISKISKKAINDGLLFSQDLESTNLNLENFQNKDYIVKLKKPIPFSIKLTNKEYHFENLELNISGKTNQKEKLRESIQNEFIKCFNSPSEERQLIIDEFILSITNL